MGVTNTNVIAYKLVASGSVVLDLFNDEDILISNNITGLFDIGVLPAEFSRTILLPGTKKNNAFFEHVYDISVDNPYLFATNVKVPAYLDFDGIYIASGYLQLNKVNFYESDGIESYEVSLFGSVSNFSRDINRLFLTDLSSLRQFNHTASYNAITSSWNGELFNGAIVYPMAEYGQAMTFIPSDTTFGINTTSGSLNVQDWKPSIRLKEVWDAVFDTLGYTYTSEFWDEPFLNNVYMICNNNLKYIQLEGDYYGSASIDLENYGTFRITSPPSSSAYTPKTPMTAGSKLALPWNSIEGNRSGLLNSSLEYNLPISSSLLGEMKLVLEVSQSSTPGNGVPSFELVISGSSGNATVPLEAVNTFFNNVKRADITQGVPTATRIYTVAQQFNSGYLNPGIYKFYLRYTNNGGTNFGIFLDANSKPESYLQLKKVKNAGEGLLLDIPSNMPFGTTGIKLVDFIKGVQKKFNLVLYPDNTKPNAFIVETFNNWYNNGRVKDFNKFINLNDRVECIPANDLAVNELDFGDTLDTDYVSQQFSKGANREYGKSYYIDTANYFSQGKFEVKTTFASSPLLYVTGTGQSGSAAVTNYEVSVADGFDSLVPVTCLGTSYDDTFYATTITLYDDQGNVTTNYGADIIVSVDYTITPCFGSPFTQTVDIIVGYGATGATYVYPQTAYVDCGSSPCVTETKVIDCISAVSNATIKTSSPIIAC